jgi:hypothetical protein
VRSVPNNYIDEPTIACDKRLLNASTRPGV